MTNNEFKKILDQSLDIICTFDQKGQFIWVNGAATSILGYQAHELEGRPYLEFVVEEDREKTAVASAAIVAGTKMTNFENRYIRKDGSLVPMIWSAKWDEDEKIMYCIARDATEKKLTEEQLKISEQRFKALVQDGSDLIGILDLEANFTYVSPTSVSVLGMHPEEFIGKNTFDFIHPADKEEVLSNFLKLESEKRVYISPFRFKHKNGSWRWVETVVTNMMEEPAVAGIVANSRDVTERIQSEYQLKESEGKLRSALAIAQLGYWQIKPNGQDLFWSDEVYEIWGVEKDKFELNFHAFFDTIHPDDRERFTLEQEASISGNKNFDFIHRIVLPDGTIKWVHEVGRLEKDEAGKPVIFQGSVQDITLQKREEQRLKLLESVVTNTSDAVIITEAEPYDEPGHKIIYVNEAFTKLTGYSAEEVIGKTPRILQGPKSDKAELSRLKEAIKKWESCEITTINYKKNGEEFWVNFSISPVADEKGWFTHWIAIERDVTQQKNEALQKRLMGKINRLFNKELTLSHTLERVLGHLVRYGDFALAEAWLISADHQQLNLLAKYPNDEVTSSFYQDECIKSFGYGEGLPGLVWKKKKFILWDKKSIEEEFVRKGVAQKAKLKAALGLPLHHNGQVEGVLVFCSDQAKHKLAYFENFFNKLEFTLGAELKRKQLESELNQIFNTAPDIICLADIKGRFKRVNAAAQHLLGYSQDELLQMPYNKLVHPNDYDIFAEEVGKLSGAENTFYFENRYIAKSGEIIWLAWTCNSSEEEGLIYAVAKDITEKKELQNLLENATNLSRIGGWSVDLVNRKVYWSNMTKTILEVGEKYQPSITGGFELYEEKSKKLVNTAVEKLIDKGETFDLELLLYTAKGKPQWVRCMGQSERVGDQCTRIFGSFQDIHQRKEHEESLKRLNESLDLHARELALSNAELEQFAFVASHDLQEPLRMVTSFLTRLETKYADVLDEKAKQYIYFAVDGAKRMRQIILELLNFSRVGRHEGEKELINLNDLVKEVCALQQKAIAEKSAKVIIEALPTFEVHKAPLVQIFQNLISNAIKYSRKNTPPEIRVSAEESNKGWTFAVKDNGIGIEAEYFDKIFVIFQRLHGKDEYEGTGMGLAIVKKIIENAGEKIWVESREGEGTSIYFTLSR